jgi:DNA-binding beta-propeller fold protein YncE
MLAGCLGCASAPVSPWQPAATRLIWPRPPDLPRIGYQGAITARQASRFQSSFSALFDLLAGRPKVTFGRPHGVAADPTTLAIADSARGQVHLLDLTRRRYRAIADAAGTPLQCPIGVATDDDGGVFVADSAQARVFHFSRRGKLLAEIGGEFIRPTGLAFDPARGRLHVVDTGEHTVFSFQRSEKGFFLLRKLGARGEDFGGFNFPTHATVDRQGNLYITDTLNFRIQIFDPEGAPLSSFGKAGDGRGDFAKAKGVAVDSEGHIYVVDSLYDVVQIYDRDGRFLLAFGGTGRTEGLLWLPTGICIDEEDRVYVADSDNARVQVFQYLHESP